MLYKSTEPIKKRKKKEKQTQTYKHKDTHIQTKTTMGMQTWRRRVLGARSRPCFVI